jgi:acyl-CoA reductase-like NAD-dependent aldehyde dehydrogenase
LPFLDGPVRLFIDGEFIETGATIPTIDPGTGELLADVALAGQGEVDAAVAAARRAFEGWRFTPPTERARLMWRLADLLESHSEEFAAIEVLDNGKPLREAQAVDIPLTIEIFRYYAGWTTKITGGVLPNSIPGMLTLRKREPVGVVAAITPWNFPLLETAYKLGPALSAGCTVVVKPAEWTPLSALRFAELVREAGFPPGVVNVINGPGDSVGAALVRHPGVDKVAFTGSTEVGQEIMVACSEGLKRFSLELGGKSPNIVFADADLEAAGGGAFGAIFFNQGQACVAGSRLFVEERIADDFAERLAQKASAMRLGHGLDLSTDMGPLVSAAHRDKVLGYIDIAREEGAEILVGGRKPEQEELAKGFFLEPTVITQVENKMRVAQEEIFGPVLTVLRWSDLDELEEMANDVRYGIAAGIWTRDTSKALKLADRLDVASVWINTYGMFDVAVPFGGRKMSGYGRELGEEALESYLQSKSVWIDLDAPVPESGQGITR